MNVKLKIGNDSYDRTHPAHLHTRTRVSVILDRAEHIPARGVHHVRHPERGGHVRKHEERHQVALVGPVQSVATQVVVKPGPTNSRHSNAHKQGSHGAHRIKPTCIPPSNPNGQSVTCIPPSNPNGRHLRSYIDWISCSNQLSRRRVGVTTEGGHSSRLNRW